MADVFSCYEELSRKMTEDKDYRITAVAERRGSNVAVIAPHGGKIEHGTSEIAKEIAADRHRLYLFEGIMAKDNFAHLHVTSHRFSEPRCLDLIAECSVVVAVHGRRDMGNLETTEVSGLDAKLIDAIIRHLSVCKFDTAIGVRFPATEITNVCNRGKSGRGAQIEIPHTLRLSLERESERRRLYASAVRAAIDEVADSHLS